MTIASGTIQYQLGTIPVTGCGFSYSETELDSALSGPVAEIVFDNSGKDDFRNLLEGLPATEFKKDRVERILTETKPPENWRVGEAFAESYLVHKKNCFFPWPNGRDKKNPGSSLPGADLVGFKSNKGNDYFVFGEVKTSTENRYPPRIMYGRAGLKRQIEDLKDSIEIKDTLVKYLGFRATNSSWQLRYKNAAEKYLSSDTNVYIFGFLVRDVKPHEKDLRARINKLSKNQHKDMVIELLAIYLPENSIPTLSDKVVASRYGGAV